MTENLSFNTSIQTLKELNSIQTSKEVNSIQNSKEVNSTQISKKEHFRKDNDQIHFMNSCRFKVLFLLVLDKTNLQKGVNSFLEISFVLLCSFLKGTQLKNYFFELLRECFEQYDALLSSENSDYEEENNVKEEFLALMHFFTALLLLFLWIFGSYKSSN